MQSSYPGKQSAAVTIQKEIVTLRMTLKAAVRYGLLNHMPDMSAPYRCSAKVSHRAWFSPEEYKTPSYQITSIQDCKDYPCVCWFIVFTAWWPH